MTSLLTSLKAVIDAWRDTPHGGTWRDAIEACADEIEELLEEHATWMPMTDRPEPGDGDAAGNVVVLHADNEVSVQDIASFPWPRLIGSKPVGWTPVVIDV